ncbi:glutathione S-transferase C-terminal domain-containing protein [Caldithrix abyssi]|nr:glutathione S-transferase C-terminal domain-containing protein [Caldithrix abyssi]
MALSYAGVKVELREILLKDRPAELHAISSKATVPVMELPDGRVIDESFDIMLWALDHADSDWLRIDEKKQFKMVKINDQDFKPWLNKYKYHDQHPENALEYYQDRCHQFLSEYEQQLKHHSYLLGEKPQLADVALFPFVRQFANVNRPYFIEKYPYLEKWLHNWTESDLFKSIMGKYDQWKPEHEPLIIAFS